MCFPSSPAPQAQQTAAAPAAPLPPPEATEIGAARKREELDAFGKPVTQSPTRIDRTVDVQGGSGTNTPKGSGIDI